MNPYQLDFRWADLTQLDLSNSLGLLSMANFDNKTQWPPARKLPKGFSLRKVMGLAKDPGLGMRKLHNRGINGKGIKIAILDLTLLTDHVEYANRLKLYEEAEDVVGGWLQTSMHGPAVASIAVGKTVGVAPNAELYFIAEGGCYTFNGDLADFDSLCRAKDVRRIIEINKSLPEGQKIRVLSMSFGWLPQQKGYQEMVDAVNEAKAAGIFVVSTSIDETYGFRFHGLGRYFLDDPNDFNSYTVGAWWANQFYSGNYPLKDTLLVPMDARATASPTGLNDYVYYGQGGESWSVPYIAATFALACQVRPDITPEEFWSTALETGRIIQLQHEGKAYSLGKILDPQALIAALEE
jgi:subtilisin family serine protease